VADEEAQKAVTEAAQFGKNYAVPPSAEADETASSRPLAEPAVTEPKTVQPDQVDRKRQRPTAQTRKRHHRTGPTRKQPSQVMVNRS